MKASQLRRLLLVMCGVGLLFSIYAGIEVVDPGAQSVCSVSSTVSCAAVASSGHTNLGPIPDWLIGLAGFVVLLAFAILYFQTRDRAYLQVLIALSSLALLISAYLAYVEVGVIHAICPVCVGAYLSNVAVWAIAVALWRRRKTSPAPSKSSTPAGA
jgi:uncharacterized membrane protein